jgi:hypothetical protein
METFSPIHWIILLTVLAIVGYPVGRILSRLGFSPWWALLWFVPLANLIGLWVLAFSRWNSHPEREG